MFIIITLANPLTMIKPFISWIKTTGTPELPYIFNSLKFMDDYIFLFFAKVVDAIPGLWTCPFFSDVLPFFLGHASVSEVGVGGDFRDGWESCSNINHFLKFIMNIYYCHKLKGEIHMAQFSPNMQVILTEIIGPKTNEKIVGILSPDQFQSSPDVGRAATAVRDQTRSTWFPGLLGGENIAHGHRYNALGVQVDANVVTINEPMKVSYEVSVGASLDSPVNQAMYMF